MDRLADALYPDADVVGMLRAVPICRVGNRLRQPGCTARQAGIIAIWISKRGELSLVPAVHGFRTR